MSEPNDDDSVAIEARIVGALRTLAEPRSIDGQQFPPPSYVRRHLVEHAHAGGVLNDETLPIPFLPYIDVVRLRELETDPTHSHLGPIGALSLMPLLRKVSHRWDWDHPGANAAAIELWSASSGRQVSIPRADQAWHVRWATSNPDESEFLGGHGDAVFALAAGQLPDGRAVAVSGSRDDTCRAWDIGAGTSISDPFRGHSGSILAIATTTQSNGHLVATSVGGDDLVLVWDVVVGSQIGPPLGVAHRSAVSIATASIHASCAVALIGYADGAVRVWDLSSRSLLGEVSACAGGPVWVMGAGISVDDELVAVAGCHDGSIRILNVNTSTLSEPIIGHVVPVTALSTVTRHDGALLAVTGGRDGVLRLWDTATGLQTGLSITTHGRDVSALAAAELSDGRLVAVVAYRNDSSAIVYDLLKRDQIGPRLVGHTATVSAVAIQTLPGGRLVAVTGSHDGTVRTWDLATGRPVGTPLVQGQLEYVNAAAGVVFRGESVVVAANRVGAVELWRASDGKSLGRRLTKSMALSPGIGAVSMPDGGLRVAIGGSRLELWDPETGGEITHAPGPNIGGVYSFATIMNSQRMIAVVIRKGKSDAEVGLEDLATGLTIGRPVGLGRAHGSLLDARLLADGRVVAATSHLDLLVWDLEGKLLDRRKVGLAGWATALAMVPSGDGRLKGVIGKRDGRVVLWDLDRNVPLGEVVDGHRGEVTAAAAVSLPDGRPVGITGSRDRTVRAWDLVTGMPIGDTLLVPYGVGALAGIGPRSGGLVVCCGPMLAAVELPGAHML